MTTLEIRERVRGTRLLKQLAQHTALTTLTLRNNVINDIHLPLLTPLTFLRSLTLNNEHQEHLTVIAALTQLTTLNLRDNSFGNEALCLFSLPRLTALNLQSNNLTQVCTPCSSLRSLNLRLNSIHNFSPLWTTSTLTKLELGFQSPHSFLHLGLLGSSPSLSSLDIQEWNLDEEGALVLSQCCALRKLSIGYKAPTKAVFQTLVSMTSLTNLHVPDAELKCDFFSLPFSSSLTKLDLSSHSLSSEMIDDLGYQKALQHLILDCNTYEFRCSESQQSMGKALSTLTVAKLSLRSWTLRDEILTSWSPNSFLTDLDLSGNVIGAQGLAALARFPSLQTLTLRWSHSWSEYKALLPSTSLLTVDLDFPSSQLPALDTVLRSNRRRVQCPFLTFVYMVAKWRG